MVHTRDRHASNLAFSFPVLIFKGVCKVYVNLPFYSIALSYQCHGHMQFGFRFVTLDQ